MGESGSRRAWVRVRRHLRWARRQGVGRLIEEDQLDPRARRRAAAARGRWVADHPGIAPDACPVFLLGVQRSGTNMLVRGFEASGSFDVVNENDRRGFERFRLKPLPEIRRLIEASPHRHVLMKPLTESHRALELLDGLRTPTSPRAIWAVRGVDARVRSAVAKFGENNLLALRAIASDTPIDHLTVGGPAPEIVAMVDAGLSEASRAFVRSIDLDDLDAEGGAALFWFVRNIAFYDQGLDERDDVLLVSYERMIDGPEPTMRAVCAFLQTGFDPALIAHIQRRDPAAARPLALPDAIRSACDDLASRFVQTEERQTARLASTDGSR